MYTNARLYLNILLCFMFFKGFHANDDLLHDCDFFDMSKDVLWKLPPDCTYFHGRGYPVSGYEVGLKLGEAIASSKSLRTVDLGGCGLGDEGVRGVLEWIDDSIQIESLFMGNNQITATGAKYLADMMKNNVKLKKLDLGFNLLKSAGAKVLSEAFRDHCSLETVILEGNGIDDAGMTSISLALSDFQCYPRGVQTLHLGGNRIGEKGAISIATMLALDPVIRNLDLGYNEIGNTGMRMICDALRFNINLKVLDVENNQLTGSSWHNISNGGIMVLDTLKIRQNDVTIDSVIKFMNVCHSLRNLDIGHCGLSIEEVKMFASAVQNNFYIRHIAMDGNSFNEDNSNLLVEAIIYRSCINRPVEIVTDFMDVNEVAFLSPRSCSGGILMDGTLRHKEF